MDRGLKRDENDKRRAQMRKYDCQRAGNLRIQKYSRFVKRKKRKKNMKKKKKCNNEWKR